MPAQDGQYPDRHDPLAGVAAPYQRLDIGEEQDDRNRDHLGGRFPFGQKRRRDDHPAISGHGTQAGDEKLPDHDDYHHPAPRVAEGHEGQKGGGDQDLIRQGVHEPSEAGVMPELAGVVTVGQVGQGGQYKDHGGRQPPVVMLELHEDHEYGGKQYPSQGQEIGEIHLPAFLENRLRPEFKVAVRKGFLTAHKPGGWGNLWGLTGGVKGGGKRAIGNRFNGFIIY